MARLPHIDRAIIPEAKIAKYLLSDQHPIGRAKARFLELFGFHARDWQVLRDAIKSHAEANEVTASIQSPFGVRLEVDGPLSSPDGRNPVVRVVWFVERRDAAPRLVTLIPRIAR